MGFYGTYFHQMDGKNRIRIPAKLRAELGKEYYFMVRPQGCIGVLPQAELDKLIEKLSEVTTGNPKKVAAKRALLGSVVQVTEDEQGRVLVSNFFREFAHLGKDVVTVGNGNILEIWAKETYEAQMQEMSIDEAFEIVDI